MIQRKKNYNNFGFQKVARIGRMGFCRIEPCILLFWQTMVQKISQDMDWIEPTSSDHSDFPCLCHAYLNVEGGQPLLETEFRWLDQSVDVANSYFRSWIYGIRWVSMFKSSTKSTDRSCQVISLGGKAIIHPDLVAFPPGPVPQTMKEFFKISSLPQNIWSVPTTRIKIMQL